MKKQTSKLIRGISLLVALAFLFVNFPLINQERNIAGVLITIIAIWSFIE